MTGISSPYEAPENPEIRVQTIGREAAEVAGEIRAAVDAIVRRS